MKLLVLIRDLVFSSHIRTTAGEGGIECSSSRENAQFLENLTQDHPDIVAVDLNIQGADPFEALQAALSQPKSPRTICFYSHVNEELAEKAEGMGIKEVYRRSKFFKDLRTILGINT